VRKAIESFSRLTLCDSKKNLGRGREEARETGFTLVI